jgi:hypothetical protein
MVRQAPFRINGPCVNDLINHLSDHYKGNDFYCSSRDHERIVDLWVEGDHRQGSHCRSTRMVIAETQGFPRTGSTVSTGSGKKFLVVKETVSFSEVGPLPEAQLSYPHSPASNVGQRFSSSIDSMLLLSDSS